jgi:hypothetical protein
MTDTPERIKLLKSYRWPTDQYGQELDIGDYVMFIYYASMPMACIGRIIKVSRSGKITAQIIKTGSRNDSSEQEIKECRTVSKLSGNMVNALMLDKLARE